MFTITHQPLAGWRIMTDGPINPETQEKTRIPWSCVDMEYFEDAVDVLAMHGLKPLLKCETCGSTKDVQPEALGENNFLMSCYRCRDVVIGPAVPDGQQPKKSKKTHVVREISRPKFQALIRKELRRFDMKTTGSPKLDKEFKMPHAQHAEKVTPMILDADELPDGCQLCGAPLTLEFVDGIVCHAGWAYMCCRCHKENGIGLGNGRGQKYLLNKDGKFHKVEHTHRETEPGTKCSNPNCAECNDAEIKRP